MDQPMQRLYEMNSTFLHGAYFNPKSHFSVSPSFKKRMLHPNFCQGQWQMMLVRVRVQLRWSLYNMWLPEAYMYQPKIVSCLNSYNNGQMVCMSSNIFKKFSIFSKIRKNLTNLEQILTKNVLSSCFFLVILCFQGSKDVKNGLYVF